MTSLWLLISISSLRWDDGKSHMTSLFDAARACLDASSPDDKVALTQHYAAAFARGEFATLEDV